MKRAYRDIAMGPSRLAIVDHANAIIAEYEAQGYKLTLRQLYYQFVARDLIPNKDSEYKRLGDIIADARYSGRISWEAIEDRTRNLRDLTHWSTAEQIVFDASGWYREEKWTGQDYRPEVWVEKEALAGIVERTCQDLDVPFIACRGYMSASEMWEAAQRFRRYYDNGQTPLVLHLGDHDPSGIDMSRDIEDRLNEFLRAHDCYEIEFRRLALNMDQVDEYNPPPNPAKLTDSRCTGYMDRFGDESWELDALEPSVLDGLMRTAILDVRDAHAWKEAEEAEREEARKIRRIWARWGEVMDLISAVPESEGAP